MKTDGARPESGPAGSMTRGSAGPEAGPAGSMTRSGRWLFSAPIDLAVFGGTAVVALVLVVLAPALGIGRDAPEWSWIVGVLLVDVAHVWSTTFVVYLDPVEWKRRPLLYALTPVAAFGVGVALYSWGPGPFWRAIAYLAVYHFIRQQYGWVMMYRGRNGERDRLGRGLDGATIYFATIYPLVWWHAHLPRDFAWMRSGDFLTGLPIWLADATGLVYLALLAIYVGRAIAQLVRREPVSWGKHLVVVTTAACWYVGIVATNTDYTFTITNVLIHGVPYMALVYIYARNAAREPEAKHGANARLFTKGRGIVLFLSTLWVIAYVEELLWDRALWHDREWLFGSGLEIGTGAVILAPLLAVPQLTHYFLDGFLWRRRANPRLGRLL
ncbi:MAG TPA: hypothetical protein VIV11_23410 [Kofleriaceae bacterium]